MEGITARRTLPIITFFFFKCFHFLLYAEAMNKTDEESETLHRQLLDGEISLPVFVQKYKRLRNTYHRRALTHLAAKTSLTAWAGRHVHVYVNTANRRLLPLIQYQLLNRRSLCLKKCSDVYCLGEMLCILNILGFKCFEMLYLWASTILQCIGDPILLCVRSWLYLVIWFLV